MVGRSTTAASRFPFHQPDTLGGMNVDVLRCLRCPLCDQPLRLTEVTGTRSLHCPDRHSFDVARQGYVNLLAGRSTHQGDTAEMVAARENFLSGGHYDFITAALAASARSGIGSDPQQRRDGPPLVIDVGAGTGRHLAAVLDSLPGAVGLALDVAKPAIRRAARAHPRIGAVLGDTWAKLPVAHGCASVLLNVFAPRNGPEFRRVLRPDGLLLVVTPVATHLVELVDQLDLLRVDPAKTERVAGALAGNFHPISQHEYGRQLRLNRREVWTLVSMGPSAWHADPARLAERIALLPEPVTVTAAVRLTAYRPLPA